MPSSWLEQPIVGDIWRDKYAALNEQTYADAGARIGAALFGADSARAAEIAQAMQERLIVPAGRILAGAGTDKRVTLINCFVSPDVQDSMATVPGRGGAGIMDALAVGAYTQQMGGGIGTDFSTIRPRGAVVHRTQSVSSGVLPFMEMWDAMCATIRSSGARRGAMMGTLAVWHPDIEEFIEAKQQPKRLENFNVSILVPDDFMRAVGQDSWWYLHFGVPRASGEHEEQWKTQGGSTRYAYKRVRARELWEKITRAT